MREAFESSGSLASVDVLAAIGGIGRRRESGTLRIAGPSGEAVRFGFAEGVLVALDPPAESGPADVLIRAGKVQRATYEALTVGGFEDRFAVAAASGVISRREANWGLKISAIESLVRVLSWGEGEYAWEEGEPEPTAPPLKLRIDQWLLELFLRSNDRGFVVRKVGPTDVPVARAEGFGEAFGALGLTADADAVVEGIDGRRTVDEVVKRSRAEEFATLKLLAALITLGLVLPIHEIPETAGETDSPAPSPEPAGAPPIEESTPEPGEFELAGPPALPGPPEPEPPPEPELDETTWEPSAAREGAAPEEAAEPEFESEPAEASESSFEEPADAPEFPFPEERESFPPDAAGPTSPPLREISVPLFALTAPEPEGNPVAESEERSGEGPVSPHRSLGGIRAAAVFAALAIVGILLVVRRRPAAPAASGQKPPAASPLPAPRPPSVEPKTAAGAPAVAESPRETVSPAPEPVREKTSEPAGVPPPRTAPKNSQPAKTSRTAKPDSWEALARAGKAAFEHPGAHRYAIQLELACEESTLQKAFAADPARRRIWLAPYSFRGRSCYRVLWGKYRDLASAKAGKSAIPEMFSRDGNHPAVVPLGRAK
ncbi:MAG TPA: DUF4388 domain-containing protein [Thermoanaerobaculia bacterium]|nr:DUF4388 domain-containing protein [Thermoanaerobaculia bacterium]